MHPVIHLFGRAFGTYGLCAFVGFILAFLVVWRLAKRYGNTIDDVLLLGISIGVGLFLGGHLLYAITRADLVVKAFGDVGREPVRVWYVEMAEAFGGMVFYGGFLGGLGGLLIFTRFYRDLKRENALDLYAVATPLFHTFGRIGCFFGGCCFGKESDWGFLVRENRYYPEMVGVVKERVAALRSDYPTVENFDVVEDPRLKGPACILETGAGVADASVETQLAAIEQSLARHISRS